MVYSIPYKLSGCITILFTSTKPGSKESLSLSQSDITTPLSLLQDTVATLLILGSFFHNGSLKSTKWYNLFTWRIKDEVV